jgi:hypothetical protein
LKEQDINWEDAPEGATHYDIKDEHTPWMKNEEGVWYYYSRNGCWALLVFDYAEYSTESFIPKDTSVKENSYTQPKRDPFIDVLNKCISQKLTLEEYIATIPSDKEDNNLGNIVEDLLSDYFDIVEPSEENPQPEDCFGLVKQQEELAQKYLQKSFAAEEDTFKPVSWYDYEKEETVGLPEKGELVYDRHQQEDVEYLCKLHYEETFILETKDGKCYDSLITHIKPLNYKGCPTYKARKEQHKLLESLVGDVASRLQGYTYKAGAIELYNKGWRVKVSEDA